MARLPAMLQGFGDGPCESRLPSQVRSVCPDIIITFSTIDGLKTTRHGIINIKILPDMSVVLYIRI